MHLIKCSVESYFVINGMCSKKILRELINEGVKFRNDKVISQFVLQHDNDS